MKPLRSKNNVRPKTKARQRAEKTGRRAEFVAQIWLMAQAFQVIARRYKSPVGEIDIVAKRGSLLVFVEVKARAKTTQFERAAEAVNQRRIVAAANHFLAHHKNMSNCNIRFDVIFVAPWRVPTHMSDAFRPE